MGLILFVTSAEEKVKHSSRDKEPSGRVSSQGVLNPRNLKQLQNHQAISNSSHQLGKDDIYNMIQLAYHLEGLVSEITVFPDLTTVSALPEIFKTFTEILQSNASTPVSLVYDTISTWVIFMCHN